MAEELDAQLNVKMPKRLLATLREIETRHGISPADSLRRLGEEMTRFYEEHGWFAFPVAVAPLMHHAPQKIDVWGLDPRCKYHLDDPEVVQDVLVQLGIWDRIVSALDEKKSGRFVGAFDNHPTHWLWLLAGSEVSDNVGRQLVFEALPKSKMTRIQMTDALRSGNESRGVKDEPVFLQIPSAARFQPPQPSASTGRSKGPKTVAKR